MLIGTVFFDINGNGKFGDAGVLTDPADDDIIAATNRSGEFGRDALARLTATLPPGEAIAAIQAVGIDASTGYYVSDLRAPRGATVVSPLTSLLRSNSDEIVAANIGLGMTAAQISTFDAVAAMSSADQTLAATARRAIALNLKLLAFAGLANANGVGADGGIAVAENLAPVIERFVASPTDLNDAAAIAVILERSSAALRSSPAGRAAAAQLLSRYGQAIDAYLTGPAAIAPIEYGLHLRVLPELLALFNGNSPLTARVTAMTVDDLRTAFASYTDIPPISISGASFVAVVDYRSLSRFSAFNNLTLDTVCQTPFTASPTCNDLGIGSSISNGATGAPSIVAVSVPAAFRSRITATLAADGKIVVQRLTGEVGMAWFDYDARTTSGFTSSSRVYVRLNDDI